MPTAKKQKPTRTDRQKPLDPPAAVNIDGLLDAQIFLQISEPKKRAFLVAFVGCGSREKAANLAGCTSRSHLYWLAKDPVYARAFEEAETLAAALIEEAMFKRAVEGTSKGVYWNGELVATERIYSDTAGIFLLKGLKGGRYREKSTIEHDLSPAMATLLAVWQELRDHPEKAHGPLPGGGEAMLSLGEHADWMDAELEEPSAREGEGGDELAPDWQAEQQAMEGEDDAGGPA